MIADELADSRLPFYFPYDQRAAILKESPVYTSKLDIARIAKRFRVVLTHQVLHLQKGEPFVFLPYSANFLGIKRRDLPKAPSLPPKDLLCSFIGRLSHINTTDGYLLRRQVFELVRDDSRIHCYRRDINPVADKKDALHPYAFSIAVENAKEDYYFSEKLIDCILSGSIPIYWGCPSIRDIFDSCGILSFDTIDGLKCILDNISLDLCEDLRRFAVVNLNIAASKDLVDFEGYLRRAFNALSPSLKHRKQIPLRLTYGKRAKLMARARELSHSLSLIQHHNEVNIVSI